MNLFTHHARSHQVKDYRLLFCIYLLRQYEKKFSKNSMKIYLAEHLPLRSEEQEKKEFNNMEYHKQLFMVWLMYLSLSQQEELFSELTKACFSKDDYDKYFYLRDKERWILSFEAYFKYLAKVAWDQLTFYEQQRIKEQYQAFLLFWINLMDQQILYLTNIRDELVKVISLQTEIIRQVRADIVENVVRLHNDLPVLSPEGEAFRKDVIHQAEKFRDNDFITMQDFFNFGLNAKKKISEFLKEDGYSPEIISTFQDKHAVQENYLKYGAALENSNKVLKEKAVKLNGILEKMSHDKEKLIDKAGSLGSDFNAMKDLADSNKSLIVEQVGDLKEISSQLVFEEERNRCFIEDIKDMDPELAEKINEVNVEQNIAIKEIDMRSNKEVLKDVFIEDDDFGLSMPDLNKNHP